MAKPDVPLTDAELKSAALGLLSRREQSAQELTEKLLNKGGEPVQIKALIGWLQQQNYQSDQRFSLLLVRSKANKGYGLSYIKQAARQYGIAATDISDAAMELELDWFELAAQQYRKKFVDQPIRDLQDRQKRMAYLQRRGFSHEQIQAALQSQDS